MKKIKVFILCLVTGVSVSHAQFNKLVDFSGLFRMNGTYNNLNGPVLANDSLTERRSSNGYALFDFGVNVAPYKDLKVSAILRSRSQIGAFYGLGNIIQFRQFRVEGNLAKVIKYQLGDIDVSMSKYTLFNPDEIYRNYESEAFLLRRSIVAYENFNVGNNWRMQGGQCESSLLFSRYVERVKGKVIMTRVRKANITNIPDRFVLGGTLSVLQSKFFQAGVNYVTVFDNVGSALDTAYQYSNRLLTGEYKFTLEREKFLVNFYGEAGPSYFKYFVRSQSKTEKFHDYFYDLGLAAVYKPVNLKFFGGYRNVGPLFSSPTAQTMRLLPFNTPTELSRINNGRNVRQATIYDFMTQEGLYNQSIYVGLMQYLPIYGNVTPYGPATPNRAGVTAGLSYTDTSSVFSLDGKADVLSEIIGEGTDDLRKFNAFQGGFRLNLGKLINLKKQLGVSFGMRHEQTTRSGPAPINFTSNLIDGGLNYELANKFDILLGAKYLTGSGNELLGQRDLFNNIKSFNDYIIDAKQVILTGGIRYRFFGYSYFSLQYNHFNNKDSKSPTSSYQWGQVWGNLTISF